MIYTVTFNPSLDYMVSVEDFQWGGTNRTSEETLVPGGKGINVSLVLKHLGMESTAMGLVAGFTGEEIVRRVEELGVHAEFIILEQGFSRINVKLREKVQEQWKTSEEGWAQVAAVSEEGKMQRVRVLKETELNGSGPDIPQEKLQELMNKLDALQSGDILVLAGSISRSLPSDIYQQIMKRLSSRGIYIVVDATKELLTKVLEFHPFLIKPNHQELGEIFGVKLSTREEVIPYGRELQKMGAENVLISMGGEGAVLITENGRVLEASAPEGKMVNSVGAGDSMVAGFLAGWLKQQDYEHAFYMGIAAGSASAFSEGFANREKIEELYGRLFLKK